MAKKSDTNVYVYGWMDSAVVYFIDPINGPGWVETISRKNASGNPIIYQVPKMISMYNKYMHGVDVFDQVRKMFGCDLGHGTKKYTVRVMEILFSMILAQAYNMHRFIHKGTDATLCHTEFKRSVIGGFLSHHVVTPMLLPLTNQGHTLLHFEPGTANDGTLRRKQLKCRQCGKKTQWYCVECQVGYNQNCFYAAHPTVEASPITPARRLFSARSNSSGGSDGSNT